MHVNLSNSEIQCVSQSLVKSWVIFFIKNSKIIMFVCQLGMHIHKISLGKFLWIFVCYFFISHPFTYTLQEEKKRRVLLVVCYMPATWLTILLGNSETWLTLVITKKKLSRPRPSIRAWQLQQILFCFCSNNY